MSLRDAQTMHVSDMLAVLAWDSVILLIWPLRWLEFTCLQAHFYIEGKKLRNALDCQELRRFYSSDSGAVLLVIRWVRTVERKI